MNGRRLCRDEDRTNNNINQILIWRVITMDNIHELVYGLRDKDKETMQKLIFKDIEKSLELIGKI
ncbi:MAG TPA: hypothetical protein GYA03_09060 [Tissierellia bacterium]|jgi:predicted transcriptional regulator|nr:hypothetical protein [Tissierellia bacterium]